MLPEAPLFWERRGAASTLLLPASAVYDAVRRVNRAMASPVRVRVPVICIGNVVAGGAGKTPAALFVAQMVKLLGFAPFFLSRGYGGSMYGPVLVDLNLHSAKDVGDEPLLLAKTAPVVVSTDRLAGAEMAIAKGAQAIIMDDGFQNHALHKDFSLLVVDAKYGFGNGRLLPAGPLREPMASGLKRADAVLAMDGTLDVHGEKVLLHGTLLPEGDTAQWRGKKVLAFAGIGRPEKFRTTLERLGAKVEAFVPFADHHRYREPEMKALAAKAQETGAALVTTAKDAVRLPAAWRDKVSVLNVRMSITEAEQLKTALEKVLRHGA